MPSGFGKDPPDNFLAGLHEALQEHPRTAHGAGAKVHPVQLDERVQALGAVTASGLPHWRQK